MTDRCKTCHGTGYEDWAYLALEPCMECNPVTTNALDRQEAGDHYVNTVIQPVEFWQRNLWDGAACSVLKYLARYKRKNGVEDLKKAIHFVELREELGACLPVTPPPAKVSMRDFCTANRIEGRDREALFALEEYVHAFPDYRPAGARLVIAAIEAIINPR